MRSVVRTRVGGWSSGGHVGRLRRLGFRRLGACRGGGGGRWQGGRRNQRGCWGLFWWDMLGQDRRGSRMMMLLLLSVGVRLS